MDRAVPRCQSGSDRCSLGGEAAIVQDRPTHSTSLRAGLAVDPLSSRSSFMRISGGTRLSVPNIWDDTRLRQGFGVASKVVPPRGAVFLPKLSSNRPRGHHDDSHGKEPAHIQPKIAGELAGDRDASSAGCFPACRFARADLSRERARR